MSDSEQNLIYKELFSKSSKRIMSSDLRCIRKDSKRAQFFRKQGNDIYSRAHSNDKKLEESFKLYSKSIAFALKGSEDLALGYSNRSALLYRIGKHKESLSDINRALEINSFDVLVKIKILCRKIECMVALGLPHVDKIFSEISSLTQKLSESNDIITKLIAAARNASSNVNKQNFPKKNNVVKPEHKKILLEKESQNCSTVMYNERLGRHLVANKDLKPGEIIFVEKPYVGILNPSFCYMYCSHCFAKLGASIPCDSCNWCMFCSNKCKNQAWNNYHDIECSVVPYLMFSNFQIEYYNLLSLRSLIMGVKEAGGIESFKKEIETANIWTECYEKERNKDNLFKDGLYFSNGFKSIYTLSSNVLCKYQDDIPRLSTVVTTLIILSRYTSFFGPNDKFKETTDLQNNKDVLFIGAVLMQLWARSTRITQTVHKPNQVCRYPFQETSCMRDNCSVGACIPSMTFFMNHSCYPNARKYITEDQKVIIFALRPIKRNSEIRISYHHAFYEQRIRQSIMRQNLQFDCMCEACKFDWPSLLKLYKMPTENPLLYTYLYTKEESDLYDENDALVSPIINNHKNVHINQATIEKLSKAMEKAVSCLQQPSVVICELMICLSKSFEILYSSN